MNNPMFRDLRADEIEVRVAQARKNGVSLLLYKDARCDQNILDETVTPMNWQRQHTRENANCIVSIWDSEKQMWIGKEDTGTESNTEKEKSLASDSFKRACFNWGIGRELYTAPFIWVNAQDCADLKENDRKKWQCNDSFEVQEIVITNKRIVKLAIRNKKNGKIVFSWESGKQSQAPKNDTKKPEFACENCNSEISSYKNAEGKVIGAKRHCEASARMFGRVLCLSCIEKMKEQGDSE